MSSVLSVFRIQLHAINDRGISNIIQVDSDGHIAALAGVSSQYTCNLIPNLPIITPSTYSFVTHIKL